MKKNINELKPNPINPRKISKDKRQKLKLSIFLFPKMLNKTRRSNRLLEDLG